MNERFDELLRKGDSESIREAYELLRREQKDWDPAQADCDPRLPEIDVALNLERLERIALRSTPQEWISGHVESMSAVARASAALLTMIAAFVVDLLLMSWLWDKWQAEPALSLRVLLVCLAAATAALSSVIIGASTLVIVNSSSIKISRKLADLGVLGLCSMLMVSLFISNPFLSAGPIGRRGTFQPSPKAASDSTVATNDLLFIWYMNNFKKASTLQLPGFASQESLLRRQPEKRKDYMDEVAMNSPEKYAALESEVAKQTLTPELEVKASMQALWSSKEVKLVTSNGKFISPQPVDIDAAKRALQISVYPIFARVMATNSPATMVSSRDLAELLADAASTTSDNAVRVDRAKYFLECGVEGKPYFVKVPLNAVSARLSAFAGFRSPMMSER